MQSALNKSEPDVWPQIAPLLDDALGKLGEKDRDAIVLRFFENKSLAEVGVTLGASEDATKMRVNRALEKLRKFFTKRGVTLSGALIAGAVSANSVQAAPVGLAKTISAVAIAKGAAAGGSTLTLVKGALKIMAWTKAKTAVVVAVVALIATLGTIPALLTAFQTKQDRMQSENQLAKLSLSMLVLGVKGDDHHFPAATNWCNAIGGDGPNRLAISKRVVSGQVVTNFETSRVGLSPFVDPARPKLRCGYAFNSKLAGLRLHEVNPSTVMLFDSSAGWNAAGGPELASAPHGGFVIVALVDGSVHEIPKTQIQGLRWNPSN